jgi:hypothetical protein
VVWQASVWGVGLRGKGRMAGIGVGSWGQEARGKGGGEHR